MEVKHNEGISSMEYVRVEDEYGSHFIINLLTVKRYLDDNRKLKIYCYDELTEMSVYKDILDINIVDEGQEVHSVNYFKVEKDKYDGSILKTEFEGWVHMTLGSMVYLFNKEEPHIALMDVTDSVEVVSHGTPLFRKVTVSDTLTDKLEIAQLKVDGGNFYIQQDTSNTSSTILVLDSSHYKEEEGLSDLEEIEKEVEASFN